MVATFAACLLGFVNGMRHALEPDHVAAVSTLVAEQRSAKDTVRFAVAWGVGHATALLVFGAILLALRAELPAWAIDGLELVVAAMLVALGVRGIRRAARLGIEGKREAHAHGGVEHEHVGPPGHVHVRGLTFARWPLVVGLVHGLAGTGGLTALALASIASAPLALAFVVLHALGSIAGMALLAGLAGVPLARLSKNRRALPLVVAAAGSFSLVLGVAWAWPIVARVAY
jgi:hypothetical protein